MSRRLALRWTLAVVPAALFAAGPAPAQDDSGIAQRTTKSTAWVVVPSPDGRNRSGSGALIDRVQGLLLTNFHVVGRQATEARVLFPLYKNNEIVPEKEEYRKVFKAGGGIPGRVIARDGTHDLALIRLASVPPGVPPLKLAAKSPSQAEAVHSIGNPAGDALWVYTPGRVRQVYHKQWKVRADTESFDFDARVILTDSPTNPGDSGGPLVNGRGELVGLTQGGVVNAAQLSIFIDVSEIKAFLKREKITLRGSAAAPPAPATPEEAEPRPARARVTAAPPTPPDDADKAEQEAGRQLHRAKELIENGVTAKAKLRLNELIEKYPASKAAAEAKRLLEKLP